MGTGFSFERVNAADYEALRPHHAPEAVAWVAEQAGLDGGSLVVDLASGTGPALQIVRAAQRPPRSRRAGVEHAG